MQKMRCVGQKDAQNEKRWIERCRKCETLGRKIQKMKYVGQKDAENEKRWIDKCRK